MRKLQSGKIDQVVSDAPIYPKKITQFRKALADGDCLTALEDVLKHSEKNTMEAKIWAASPKARRTRDRLVAKLPPYRDSMGSIGVDL